jgi:hypothetical protein
MVVYEMSKKENMPCIVCGDTIYDQVDICPDCYAAQPYRKVIPLTNADRVRAMSDDAMLSFLVSVTRNAILYALSESLITKELREWLSSESDDDGNNIWGTLKWFCETNP